MNYMYVIYKFFTLLQNKNYKINNEVVEYAINVTNFVKYVKINNEVMSNMPKSIMKF